MCKQWRRHSSVPFIPALRSLGYSPEYIHVSTGDVKNQKHWNHFAPDFDFWVLVVKTDCCTLWNPAGHLHEVTKAERRTCYQNYTTVWFSPADVMPLLTCAISVAARIGWPTSCCGWITSDALAEVWSLFSAFTSASTENNPHPVFSVLMRLY